jgi:dimeric dUTPase (all-alpha-NTP-PPase superfamily)
MSADRLEELFALQAALNDRIFGKRGIAGNDGRILSMEALVAQARSGEGLGPNSDTARWLANFLKAHDDESRELSEELPWKWWSKDELDLQAVRVEIVDMLHFWISLALASGMDAADVTRLYKAKHAINEQRQEQGYSAREKAGRDDTGIV